MMAGELSHAIEDAAREVYETLGGSGYAESVYQHALQIELQLRGVNADIEVPCVVMYKGKAIGIGRLDLVVSVGEETVAVELKAIQKLNINAEKQLLGYMRVTGAKHGVLINFGCTSIEIKRIVP